jgi:hypothetical protein
MRRIGHAVLGVASLVVVAGCGATGGPAPASAPAAPGATPAQTYRDAGLTAQVPPGWRVSAQPLTAVSSPVQRLVVTSFPVRQRRPDPGCGPATALRQMPARGAMLFLFEYRGPTRHDVAREPGRPRHFRLDPRTLATYECLGRSYMVRFRDQGRVLQGHVYLGPDADARTRRDVLGVLDSLRVRRPTPRSAAVWVPPQRVLAGAPYLGVACREPNSLACDRVGLAVRLRAPAVAVSATIDGRPLQLDDPDWSGPVHAGRRRLLAGFLHPAGLLSGPLAPQPDDGPGRWVGRRPVEAGVGLTIAVTPMHYVRTSLRVRLAPGWG